MFLCGTVSRGLDLKRKRDGTVSDPRPCGRPPNHRDCGRRRIAVGCRRRQRRRTHRAGRSRLVVVEVVRARISWQSPQSCRPVQKQSARSAATTDGLLTVRRRLSLSARFGRGDGLRCSRDGATPLRPDGVLPVRLALIATCFGDGLNGRRLCAAYRASPVNVRSFGSVWSGPASAAAMPGRARMRSTQSARRGWDLSVIWSGNIRAAAMPQ